MNLLYFVLATFGLTQILIYGSIFNKIRPSYKFFHCSLCMGWWAGFFFWAVNPYTELFIFDYSIITAFALACVGSGTSYILDMIIGDAGINFNKVRW